LPIFGIARDFNLSQEQRVVAAVAPNKDINLSEPGQPGRFPPSARLLRHADFERVYKQGRRHFAAHMTVFYLSRPEGAGFRVGFTVGRVLGGAVDRNRMKRRLREAVRFRYPASAAAIDVVINPKKSLLRVEFPDLLDEVGQAFRVIQKASLPSAVGR
jgi:ribonuclease P protein component